MSIFDYSTTPGANTNVDGVNIAEGMPPGNVNNAMRAMMADTRKWQLDSGGFAVTGGTVNAYTMSAAQEFTDYASGMRFTFRSDRANTGNSTINISGRGAVQLRKFSAGVTVALDAGDIGQNEVIDIVYSSAIPAFVMIGKADVAENQVAMTGPGLIGRGLASAGRSLRIGFGDGIALSAGNLVANLGSGLSFASGAIVAAVTRLATQAEAEAGTSNVGAMTPLRFRQAVDSYFNAPGSAPLYAVRSWGNFGYVGSSIAIRNSGNVASITRVSVGRYRVVFQTPMPDDNYSVALAKASGPGSQMESPGLYSASGDNSSTFRLSTGFDIATRYNNTPFDIEEIHFQVVR